MDNKINLFSEYSYSESTLNIELKENAIIIQKVQTVKKKLLALLEKAAIDSELFRILCHYFNLNNERPQEVPNERNIMYLRIISYRLIKLLKLESSLPKEQLLLRLFIRLNFNKDRIIDYYINKINLQIERNPDDQEDILQCYWIESHCLPKKGFIYASENHCLGKEIQNHVFILKSQFERISELTIRSNHAGYRPLPKLISTNESAAVFMYGLNILFNNRVLERYPSMKEFIIRISELLRGKKGNKFKPDTLRARFNSTDIATMNRMSEILQDIGEQNEYNKEIYYKRKKN